MNTGKAGMTGQPEDVPLVDLQAQHQPLMDEVRCAIEEVVASGAFVVGPAVAAFESSYAAF